MKKTILAVSAIGLLLVGCNKSKKAEPVNNDTEVTETVTEEVVETPAEEENTYLYKASNGDIVEVVYLNENDPKRAQIKIGDDTMVLDQTALGEEGAKYKKDNNVLSVNRDKVTLKKGDEDLNLVLLSPLTYEYKGDKDSITVTYYFEGDKHFAKLNFEGEAEPVVLEQTTSWAKGAEYGTGDVKWIAKSDSAELEKDGKKTTYKQIN